MTGEARELIELLGVYQRIALPMALTSRTDQWPAVRRSWQRTTVHGNGSDQSRCDNQRYLRRPALACPKCGCRIVTKVGRGRAMLICADCGHPVDDRQSRRRMNQRMVAALLMALIAALGGMVMFLAAANSSDPNEEAPAARPVLAAGAVVSVHLLLRRRGRSCRCCCVRGAFSVWAYGS